MKPIPLALYLAQQIEDSKHVYRGMQFLISNVAAELRRQHAEIERLRAGLALINCEPINAEYMAQNLLDGHQANYRGEENA